MKLLFNLHHSSNMKLLFNLDRHRMKGVYVSFIGLNPLSFPHSSRSCSCSCSIPSFSTSSASLSQQQQYPQLINVRYPLPFSLGFCTNASHARSFKNFGFEPSKEVPFTTSEKHDSVLNLFRNWGFSNSQLQEMIKREPWLLSCQPHKRVLPKFEFLLSKGASTSDILFIVTKNPGFLRPSLENHIIPIYELVHRFLQSDKETIACLMRNTLSFCSSRLTPNVKLLIDFGVTDSNIVRLLRRRPSVLCSTDLLKVVEEVKELGFTPSKTTFTAALLAKHAVSKSRWDEKVDTFKKWGWSDENILKAFRSQPNCMLASSEKINLVMSFWVNQLGWDALALVKGPILFGYSLEKRIIPRAFVLQYLIAKGLINKNASLVTPFKMSEKMFLEKFVKCFKEEETSHLLKLCQEKMNLQDNREDGSISQSSNG